MDALGYVLDQARLRPHRPDRLTVGSSILRFTTQRTLTDRMCLDTRLKAAKFKSCHHIPDREFNCQTHLQILRGVPGWPRVLYCLSVLRTRDVANGRGFRHKMLAKCAERGHDSFRQNQS